MCEEYQLVISEDNTNIMALIENDPIRSKIIVENKIMEEGSHFSGLECNITYACAGNINYKQV